MPAIQQCFDSPVGGGGGGGGGGGETGRRLMLSLHSDAVRDRGSK